VRHVGALGLVAIRRIGEGADIVRFEDDLAGEVHAGLFGGGSPRVVLGEGGNGEKAGEDG